MTPMSTAHEPTLRRDIGILLTLYGLCTILLGAGIYLLGAVVAVLSLPPDELGRSAAVAESHGSSP